MFLVSDQLSLKIDILKQSDSFPVMCVTFLQLWYESRYWSSKIDHFFDISLMSLIGILKFRRVSSKVYSFKLIVRESKTIETGYFSGRLLSSNVFRWGSHLYIWLCPVRSSVRPFVRPSQLFRYGISSQNSIQTRKQKSLNSMSKPQKHFET